MTIENEFLPTELRSLLSKAAFLGMEMRLTLSVVKATDEFPGIEMLSSLKVQYQCNLVDN